MTSNTRPLLCAGLLGAALLLAGCGESEKTEQAAATAVLARIDEGSTVRVVPEGL